MFDLIMFALPHADFYQLFTRFAFVIFAVAICIWAANKGLQMAHKKEIAEHKDFYENIRSTQGWTVMSLNGFGFASFFIAALFL